MVDATETAIPEFLKPGTRSEIGSHRFEPEDIIRFARKFDPQRFHVDEEAISISRDTTIPELGHVSLFILIERFDLETTR